MASKDEGWAHVVCTLYMPGGKFGCVNTMNNIMLSEVPQEAYDKVLVSFPLALQFLNK